MEPESAFYEDPVLVLDFQSLYPSMIIAHNLCFSTCMGKLRSGVSSRRKTEEGGDEGKREGGTRAVNSGNIGGNGGISANGNGNCSGGVIGNDIGNGSGSIVELAGTVIPTYKKGMEGGDQGENEFDEDDDEDTEAVAVAEGDGYSGAARGYHSRPYRRRGRTAYAGPDDYEGESRGIRAGGRGEERGAGRGWMRDINQRGGQLPANYARDDNNYINNGVPSVVSVSADTTERLGFLRYPEELSAAAAYDHFHNEIPISHLSSCSSSSFSSSSSAAASGATTTVRTSSFSRTARAIDPESIRCTLECFSDNSPYISPNGSMFCSKQKREGIVTCNS